MSYEITDVIQISGLQNFEKYDSLNLIEIQVSHNNITSTLGKYKKYKYRFIITGLLFGSSFTNETNVTFFTCSRLNDAKTRH